MTSPDTDELRPVDHLAVEFPPATSHFTGEMAAELDKLVTSGIIRVLDLVILTKGADGELDVLEANDLEDVGELRAAEAKLAGLLAEEDVVNLAAAMEPGTTAGVLVWENVWAGPFASAARLSERCAERRGIISGPVARTAAVAGTAAVVAHGVGRRSDRREDRRDRR
ncbi:DUF6325 family protein [Streptomyces sp. NBC_00211]|uniref:DUF6325 family protein n=1 Tax=Streptomyces sp. NBC_00211 TaxID=2975683 RepID=UPI003247818E